MVWETWDDELQAVCAYKVKGRLQSAVSHGLVSRSILIHLWGRIFDRMMIFGGMDDACYKFWDGVHAAKLPIRFEMSTRHTNVNQLSAGRGGIEKPH